MKLFAKPKEIEINEKLKKLYFTIELEPEEPKNFCEKTKCEVQYINMAMMGTNQIDSNVFHRFDQLDIPQIHTCEKQ